MNPTEDQIRAILYEFAHPERIQTSQLFRNVVFSIARGAKLHSIIEDLFTVIEDQREELEKRNGVEPSLLQINLKLEEMTQIQQKTASRPLLSEEMAGKFERRTQKIDIPDHLNKIPITPEEAFKGTSPNP